MRLHKLRISFSERELHFDRNYGINQRTGWSVAINKHCVAEFVTLWKAIKTLVRGE